MAQHVKVKAVMKTPDGNTQKVEVKDNENGTMTLKTRVKEVGEHELSVTVGRKPVQRSPVRIKVIPANGLACKIRGKLQTSNNFCGLWGIAKMKTTDVLICDADIQGLQFVSLAGGGSKQIQFTNIEGFYPNFVAVSLDDNILISDFGNKQIIVCDENGKLIRYFGQGRIKFPGGIAINPVNGWVYIVDQNIHCVHIYDQDGNHIKSFGSNGSQEGQFIRPFCVCINTIGNVYVSDRDNHRIQVFNGDGQFLFTFGCKGSVDGQMNDPYGIAVDRHGNVYVADNGNNRIMKYESHGRFVSRVDDASGQLNSPIGVCVTDDDRVIVSDRGNGCIRMYAQ
ncbi:tripartite motif-containing protein 2-like [Ptychodera flava]|uniref:tripartite motif-containing protein 2-like n=1 Tax=Ptychodera flava TaxID=63121 RepID=UPI00396A1E84